jgi:peroxiredoxin
VLSDVGSTVARAFGVAFTVPDYLGEVDERTGHPLSHYNGADDKVLPIPATFVLDHDGVVRFRGVDEDYTHRPSIDAVIEAVLELS